MSSGTGFANVVATMALAVSLASAGWSVYAFALSSEVRVLPFSDVNILSQAGIPQIQIEATVANLANNKFDDVAQDQELTIEVGGRTIRFVAVSQATPIFAFPAADGTYPTPEFPCYAGGVGVTVCPKDEGAVVALPAGEIVTPAPLFELARTECGLDVCDGVTLATLATALVGESRVTYSVRTMRDGVKSYSCTMSLSKEAAAYLAGVGWTNPHCEPDKAKEEGGAKGS